MHDHFGFYICWGVCSYLPALYTSTSQFLVTHPGHIGLNWSFILIAIGLLCICINYDADDQRQTTRDRNGNYSIWGKKVETIVANYTTGDGKKDKICCLLVVGGEFLVISIMFQN